MRFDVSKYKKEVDEDFEAAWLNGSEILGIREINKRYPRITYPYGRPHPVFEMINNLRDAYLRMGFEEAINPIIVEENDVKKQFGPESLAVLDRCFYLAGLPRPNVGVSNEQILKIEAVIGRVLSDDEKNAVKESLHLYKKGKIDGDDLISDISKRLSMDDTYGTKILSEVFPEFKELKPIPSTNTLRSHMTSGWFITLSSLLNKRDLPVRLFSIDRCFRREQKEDATRLQSYYSASCVIMDDDVTVDDGMAVSESLLLQFGFKNFKFRLDDKRSKYYIPDTQTEVFAYHPALVGSNTKYNDGWVEVATFGVYSPTALAQYDIPYPVMNLGLGVERLALILYDQKDMREMVYPQFYQEDLTDLEISKGIYVRETPKTMDGLRLALAIRDACEKYGDIASPCRFPAWKGTIYGREIIVDLVEPEDNTKLCGPAYKNKIFVKDGNIFAVPENEKFYDTYKDAMDTGITFMDAFAQLSASIIENSLISNDIKEDEIRQARIRMVKTPGEINIAIKDHILRYLTGKKKKIDIRGPFFTTVEFKLASYNKT